MLAGDNLKAVARLVVAVSAIVGLAALTQPPRTLRILFIGNSLTAANDLPAIVESLARARGDVLAKTTAVTAGNFSLEDHWNQGNARPAIAKGGWTFVLLQQGPSALPESRVLLRDYVKRFAGDARKVGAHTALYMVWPAKARSQDFDRVSESYALAARDVGGLLLPVGDAWREAWGRDPSLALYADDDFHPSRLGSYLAALTIWRALSETSVVGLPAPGGVNPSTARLLQEAADRVVAAAPAAKEFSPVLRGPRPTESADLR